MRFGKKNSKELPYTASCTHQEAPQLPEDPTLSDVQMLCSDLGISRDYIDSSDFGIDVFIPEDWDINGEYTFNGFEMWKKRNVNME